MQRNSSRAGFETEAKYRQCRFRNTSPTISDHARSPTDATGQRNHHLLALGCGEENLFPGIRGPGRCHRLLQRTEDQMVERW